MVFIWSHRRVGKAALNKEMQIAGILIQAICWYRRVEVRNENGNFWFKRSKGKPILHTKFYMIKEVNVSDKVFWLGQGSFLGIYNTLINSGSGKK